MKKIFEKVVIGNISAKNRIVRSATLEGIAVDGGHIGAEFISVYKKLSEGGSGILITGMVGIDENSRVLPLMVKAYDDAFISGLRQVVNVAHVNDCKVVVQIAHNGAKANPDNGINPLAPSEVLFNKNHTKSLTKSQISDIVQNFVATALRCKEAGADGVQIHGAHGYLLSQFLSPYFNHRTDEYGGNIANRARIVFEVYDAIRSRLNDYPVWIKINCDDLVDGGLSFEESLWVCKELDARGIDCIEISGGLGVTPESSAANKKVGEKGVYLDHALSVSDNLKASVISVCGYRTPGMIEESLNKGNIAAISLCRPLICEPELPSLWEKGDRRKSKCVSCNKCFDYATGFGCKVF